MEHQYVSCIQKYFFNLLFLKRVPIEEQRKNTIGPYQLLNKGGRGVITGGCR